MDDIDEDEYDEFGNFIGTLDEDEEENEGQDEAEELRFVANGPGDGRRAVSREVGDDDPLDGGMMEEIEGSGMQVMQVDACKSTTSSLQHTMSDNRQHGVQVRSSCRKTRFIILVQNKFMARM